MSEPQHTPELGGIHNNWWYCVVCGFATDDSVKTGVHWKSSHGEGTEATIGFDVIRGQVWLTLSYERQKWIDAQVEALHAAMHEGFGADDFVAEAEIADA